MSVCRANEQTKVVENEIAYEEAERLSNKSVVELQGVSVISGTHPDYGLLYIVIPIMGHSILLYSFENQANLFYNKV